jgi:hypothetical protein
MPLINNNRLFDRLINQITSVEDSGTTMSTQDDVPQSGTTMSNEQSDNNYFNELIGGATNRNGRYYPNSMINGWDWPYTIPAPELINNHSINVSSNFRSYLESVVVSDDVYINHCKSIKILADFLLNKRHTDKFDLLNKEIFKNINSISELPEGYVSFNNNQQMKLGRILNRIFRICISTDNYDESYYIERVINDYKSWNYDDSKFEFKYLEGYKILEGYSSDRQICNSSSLGGSCMNNRHNFLELYTNNEEKVSLLILVDKSGFIHGRALIWELDNSSHTYMDRVYVAKDSIENIFVKYARKNKMIYRTSRAEEDFMLFIPKGDKYIKKSNYKYKMDVKLNTNGIKQYPYLDSLYIKIKGKNVVTNKLGFNIIVRYNTLRRTGGEMGRLRCKVFGKLRP